jgi:hypothetical protein
MLQALPRMSVEQAGAAAAARVAAAMLTSVWGLKHQQGELIPCVMFLGHVAELLGQVRGLSQLNLHGTNDRATCGAEAV